MKINLNKEQEAFVKAEDPCIILRAGAGSGKSRAITERARHLVENGATPSEIVILTFTNLATQELMSRLKDYPDLVISTIHSYCNYLLRTNGIDTSDLLENGDFDKLFSLLKKNRDCVRPVQHLLIDEGHDTSAEQFEFIIDMVKPKNWCVCLDMKQMIYEWRDASPEAIHDLMNRPNVKIYDLKYNYRNGYKILDFAKNLISVLGGEYTDRSIAIEEGPGIVYRDVFSETSLLRYIKKIGDYNSWFILTRTNQQIEDIGKILTKNGIPYFTFKQGETTLDELNKRMSENKIALITMHSSKGLERDNVMAIDPRYWNAEGRRLAYVAATRARKSLVWMNLPSKKTKNFTY